MRILRITGLVCLYRRCGGERADSVDEQWQRRARTHIARVQLSCLKYYNSFACTLGRSRFDYMLSSAFVMPISDTIFQSFIFCMAFQALFLSRTALLQSSFQYGRGLSSLLFVFLRCWIFSFAALYIASVKRMIFQSADDIQWFLWS